VLKTVSWLGCSTVSIQRKGGRSQRHAQDGELAQLQYLVREKQRDLNACGQDSELARLQYLIIENEGDLNARTQDGTV
jgi:hypothetical protein